MAKRLQLRRGNTADHSTFIGALAELTVNTQTGSLLLHDGVTTGGHAVAMAAPVDAALATKLNASEKNAVNGVCPLDADGLVPLEKLPAASTGGVSSVATNAPLSHTGTADITLSIAAASAIQDGYMSAAYATKLDGIAANANNYVLPVAGVSLGGVKSGTDITVDASGNVSVNDDSHNHIISNVDGLQTALDGKEPAFTKNTAFNKNFGTVAGTVAEGHTHPYLPLAGGSLTGNLNVNKTGAIPTLTVGADAGFAAYLDFKQGAIVQGRLMTGVTGSVALVRFNKDTGIQEARLDLLSTGEAQIGANKVIHAGDIGVSVQGYNANTVIDASYVHTDNNYTTTEKNKLAGIADNANNYVHPASHAGSMISLSTTNFDNNLSAADDTVQKAFDTLDALIVGGGGSAQPFDDTPLGVTTTSTLLSTNSRNIVVTGDGGITITLFSSLGLTENESVLSIANLTPSSIYINLPDGTLYRKVEPYQMYVLSIYDNTITSGFYTKYIVNIEGREARFIHTYNIVTKASATKFFKISPTRWIAYYHVTIASDNNHQYFTCIEDNQDGTYTIGTTLDLANGSTAVSDIDIVSLDTVNGTKFGEGKYTSLTYNYVRGFTVNANLSITAGTQITLDSTYDQYAIDDTLLSRLSDTQSVVSYENSGSTKYLRLITWSGTTPSAGAALTVGFTFHQNVLPLNATLFALQADEGIYPVTISGTSLSVGTGYTRTDASKFYHDGIGITKFVAIDASTVVEWSSLGVAKYNVTASAVTQLGLFSKSNIKAIVKLSSTVILAVEYDGVIGWLHKLDISGDTPTVISSLTLSNEIGISSTVFNYITDVIIHTGKRLITFEYYSGSTIMALNLYTHSIVV